MIVCALLASLFVSLGAFMLFGLATDRHHERRFARRCPKRAGSRMRIAAWSLIAVAFALGICAWGPVYGPIGTMGLVMLSAGVSFLGLNLVPVRARVSKYSGSGADCADKSLAPVRGDRR